MELNEKIEYLKKSYILEMIIVPLFSIYEIISPFIVISSIPSSAEIGILLLSSLWLLMFTFVTVVIAYLAINELSEYEKNKKLILNIINLFFVLTGEVWLLAIFQGYMIYSIYKEK